MNKLTSILSQAGGLADQIGSIVNSAAASTTRDDITILVGGQIIAGWQRARITRSIERIPSDFDIELTEAFPYLSTKASITPGMPCQVKIGTDVVITGYVDAYIPTIEDGEHIVNITGRSKCQDIVDCAAEWDGYQISGTSAADIASKLASPYGIEVIMHVQKGEELKPIPQFNLMPGETAAEIIERITRYSALLYYDDVDGNLVLSRVGTNTMASGFTEGINVQRAQARFTADQKFSEYDVVLQSVATLGDLGESGFIQKKSFDPTVKRHRLKVIVCEAGAQGIEITEARATWEKNRRWGRSFQLDLLTDSWRDSSGRLWTPNFLVPVNIPSVKMENINYTIGEITYMLDENGTTARLTLMPPEAYSVEPTLIQQQPLVEEGFTLDAPGGNQNPATPGLPPPKSSIASLPKSVYRNPDGSLNQTGQDALHDLWEPDPQ